MAQSVSAFTPQWFSPPGDTIVDYLSEMSCSLADFARSMNLPIEQLDSLFEGTMPITGVMCEDLARVLGSTPNFWSRREELYRARLSRV